MTLKYRFLLYRLPVSCDMMTGGQNYRATREKFQLEYGKYPGFEQKISNPIYMYYNPCM